MNESTSQSGPGVDLSQIDDPHVRRALRAVNQQMIDTMARQQMEIEALLEILMEKHLTSVGEFKRHMMRLAQKDARGMRLHDQLMMPASAPTAAPKPVAH